MSILLIAEHNNKALKPLTLNAVTAASKIDPDVHAVVIGQNSSDAAKALSELPLVKKVIHVEAPHYENFIAENFASDYQFQNSRQYFEGCFQISWRFSVNIQNNLLRA